MMTYGQLNLIRRENLKQKLFEFTTIIRLMFIYLSNSAKLTCPGEYCQVLQCRLLYDLDKNIQSEQTHCAEV